MTFKETSLESRSPRVTELIDYQGFCGFSNNSGPSNENKHVEESFTRLSVQDVMQRLQDGWAPFVLDARLPEESAICGLPFVDLVCPHREVSKIAPNLPKVGKDLKSQSNFSSLEGTLLANVSIISFASGSRHTRALQSGGTQCKGLSKTLRNGIFEALQHGGRHSCLVQGNRSIASSLLSIKLLCIHFRR